MKVRDLMLAEVPVVSPETPLSEVAAMLKEADTAFLPVQEEDRISGVIAAEDIVSGALAEGLDMDAMTARDVMGNATVFCGVDEDAMKAFETMKGTGATQLVVLDESQNAVGILPLDRVLPLLVSAEASGDEEPSEGTA